MGPRNNTGEIQAQIERQVSRAQRARGVLPPRSAARQAPRAVERHPGALGRALRPPDDPQRDAGPGSLRRSLADPPRVPRSRLHAAAGIPRSRRRRRLCVAVRGRCPADGGDGEADPRRSDGQTTFRRASRPMPGCSTGGSCSAGTSIERLVPAGSVVLHQPRSFFEDHTGICGRRRVGVHRADRAHRQPPGAADQAPARGRRDAQQRSSATAASSTRRAS